MILLQAPIGLYLWEGFLISIIVLYIIALFDLLKSTFNDSVTKLLWLIVILFVPVAGLIFYFLIGRKQKSA